MVIGETTYNIADISKYKEALSTFDMSSIKDEAFKSSYSNLFQTSNGPVDTMSKLNLSSLPDKTVETMEKHKFSGILPPLVDPQKFKDQLREKELVISKKKRKDPRVQVVQEGKAFDRKRTFIKNWEFEEDDVNEDKVGVEVLDEEEKKVEKM